MLVLFLTVTTIFVTNIAATAAEITGTDDNEIIDAIIDFDRVDPNEFQWEQRSSLPIEELVEVKGVHHPITFSNGTHGFVLTGTTNDESYTNMFYMYDESADSWTDLSNTEYAFPGKPRSFGYGVSSSIHHSDVDCGGFGGGERERENQNQKAYLGFGAAWNDEWEFENDDADQPFELKLTDWWEFDMRSGVWKELAPFPGQGRRHPAMNYIEPLEEIHVGLGDGDGGNYNDWWKYSIANDEWTRLDDFPSTQRHHPFYFSIGTDSYVGLGHSGSFPYIERDWYKWDSVQRKWFSIGDFASYDIGSSLPSLQTTEARVAGTQFSVSSTSCNSNDNNIAPMARAAGFGAPPSTATATATTPTTTTLGFVLSGDGDDHRTMDRGEFHVFDPTGGKGTTTGEEGRYWRMLPPHPGFSRWAPGTFVLGQRVYMVGGYDRRTRILHGDMWTIDLEPLFKYAENNDDDDDDDDLINNIINDFVGNNGNNNIASANGNNIPSLNPVNSDDQTFTTVNDETNYYNSYDSGGSGTTALTAILPSSVLSSILLLLGITSLWM